MRPPCEYIVKTYLPQLRSRIIRNLIEKHGWKPSNVAKKLMLTAPSVLKYKKILEEPTIASSEFLERVAEEATELITTGRVMPESFIELICRNCMIHRIDGEICKIHRNYIAILKDCQACSNIYNFLAGETDVRREIITNIIKAFNVLSTIDNFDRLIPEVRTNIVMLVPEAKSVEDVAGYPGRLTTVKGKLFSAVRPEFNASKHLASILLNAHKVDKKVKGLICIRYDDEILKTIDKLGLKHVRFSREKDGKELGEFVISLKNIPDIIIDEGTIGIEPIIYVFGTSALEAAEKVKKIYLNLEE